MLICHKSIGVCRQACWGEAGIWLAIQQALLQHWGTRCLPAASHNSEWAQEVSKIFQVIFCLWKRNPSSHREAELAAAQGAAADGCPWRSQQHAHSQRGFTDSGYTAHFWVEIKPRSLNLSKPNSEDRAYSKGLRWGTRPPQRIAYTPQLKKGLAQGNSETQVSVEVYVMRLIRSYKLTGRDSPSL